ncbi:MAG: hypothetical protein HY368_02585, partial [Candidatus Aenigmarchaeota archaeon]|nr:hypothetical protein [Candidatus Aenigmarchaeota archaeon]
PIVRLLISNYQVNTTPALIINGTKYEGLQGREALQEILCGNYKDLCAT